MLTFEKKYHSQGVERIAGIDEAGRGPLAGPVVAAAVVLPAEVELEGVRDSKKLTALKRERLFAVIRREASDIGIGIVHERQIDKLNILQATYLAMRKAVGSLKMRPEVLLVDGNPADLPGYLQESIIHGDDRSLSIAAASIIAKVTRDRLMEQYAVVYPEYAFSSNKGYGTREHLKAIREFGAAPIHRKSFNPVSQYLPTFADFREKRKLGRLGEQLAAGGLIKLGCEIIAMNYNVPGVGEVDIIHNEAGEIVFTEVKTQLSPHNWGDPLDQIDSRKRDRIIAAASTFLQEKGIVQNARFDVISVQFYGSKPVIKRIKSGLSVV
ncbi:MAG: ribonuclease HII [FCB group bacterium]|nr:ribonuclease HII [FCB group bacterium]